MGALEDLETSLNGAVVDFQTKVADLISTAKANTTPGGDSSAVDADTANVQADETKLDSDTASLASDEASEEAGESPAPVTQIPVTDGSTPPADAAAGTPLGGDPNISL